LIIDEAQHLSPQVLEQIRIISNLETNEAKLLQIVLVGQLNLLGVLADAELRQLDQRISIRAALKPLTREEVEAYIAHRLWVARGSTAVAFESDALDLVHRFTGGVPRIINLLCDRALMAGAAARVNRVTPGLIENAAGNLGLKMPEVPQTAPRRRVPAAAVAALAAIVVAIVLFLALPPPASWIDAAAPAPPARPRLMRGEAVAARPIPTADFMPPALPVPPRPRPRVPEVPDDQVGTRPPPGA
jgi:general secretion pathway protein A